MGACYLIKNVLIIPGKYVVNTRKAKGREGKGREGKERKKEDSHKDFSTRISLPTVRTHPPFDKILPPTAPTQLVTVDFALRLGPCPASSVNNMYYSPANLAILICSD